MINTITKINSSEIFSGASIKINKKCFYVGHVCKVQDVEHAVEVLDSIGFYTESEDCLPFAIRIVEGDELIQIAEDNGEYASGEVLAEKLAKLRDYNVLICVSRKVSDCFIVDMLQGQNLVALKKAAMSAIDYFLEKSNETNQLTATEDESEIVNFNYSIDTPVKAALCRSPNGRQPLRIACVPMTQEVLVASKHDQGHIIKPRRNISTNLEKMKKTAMRASQSVKISDTTRTAQLFLSNVHSSCL